MSDHIRCGTRDCTTPAVWWLMVTPDRRIPVCPRHLDGWTTRLNHDGHAPTQRRIRPTTPAPAPQGLFP